MASSRDANTSWGFLAREFSRGNYFSFKRDGRISPQSASHVSRSAISPGILILSYYLISSVTRTNAVPPRSANWPRYIPSMFLPPSPSSICAPRGAAGRMCSIEEPRANAVSPSLLSLEIFLATENEIRRNRQLIYAGRKLVGLPRTLIENEELSTSREWRLLRISSRRREIDRDKRCLE